MPGSSSIHSPAAARERRRLRGTSWQFGGHWHASQVSGFSSEQATASALAC
jgi:hypothetical protein